MRPTGGGFLAAHLRSHDVAHVVYGAVIGLALVVALEAHPPSATQTAAAVLATAIAVGLAEVYSETIAAAAESGRRFRIRELRGAAGNATAVIVGAGFPAVFFVLAAVEWIELDRAFTLAKWTGLGLLASYGYLAARLAGTTRREALFDAALAGLVGGALIVVKALLH